TSTRANHAFRGLVLLLPHTVPPETYPLSLHDALPISVITLPGGARRTDRTGPMGATNGRRLPRCVADQSLVHRKRYADAWNAWPKGGVGLDSRGAMNTLSSGSQRPSDHHGSPGPRAGQEREARRRASDRVRWTVRRLRLAGVGLRSAGRGGRSRGHRRTGRAHASRFPTTAAGAGRTVVLDRGAADAADGRGRRFVQGRGGGADDGGDGARVLVPHVDRRRFRARHARFAPLRPR